MAFNHDRATDRRVLELVDAIRALEDRITFMEKLAYESLYTSPKRLRDLDDLRMRLQRLYEQKEAVLYG